MQVIRDATKKLVAFFIIINICKKPSNMVAVNKRYFG